MRIDVRRTIPWSELESMIRSVPLKQRAPDGSPIQVYRDARVTLRAFHHEDVNPTTFYLLQSGLELQRVLHEHLRDNYGIDTLALQGAVELLDVDAQKVWTLTPPIIEVTPREIRYVAQEAEITYEDSQRILVPIIMDGAHRVALARSLGRTFSAVHISGADPAYPFYAHPNGWDRVAVVDTVPKTKPEKKWYRMEDCYAVYRDFDVIGCGAPRGVGA